jgi:hypothetical protein
MNEMMEGSIQPSPTETSPLPSQTLRINLTYPVMEGGAPAQEVILQPGDVLYIPPYWQHRVESLTLSLSLSILSPSYLEATFAEMFWEAVPFGDFTASKSTRAAAVHLYLKLLVTALNWKKVLSKSLREIALELYFTRFQLLAAASSNSDKFFVCPSESTLPDRVIALSATSSPSPSSSPSSFQQQQQMSEEESDVAPFVEKLSKFKQSAARFAEMLQAVDAEAAIKTSFLRDYFEQIVRWAIGPKQTGAFILKCLV